MTLLFSHSLPKRIIYSIVDRILRVYYPSEEITRNLHLTMQRRLQRLSLDVLETLEVFFGLTSRAVEHYNLEVLSTNGWKVYTDYVHEGKVLFIQVICFETNPEVLCVSRVDREGHGVWVNVRHQRDAVAGLGKLICSYK